AFTRHRIGRHAEQPQPDTEGVLDLVAIDDAPQLGALDRQRNLGLAYLMAAIRAPDLEHANAYSSKAVDLLEAVHKAGLRDGEIAEGLATIYGQRQDYARAGSFAQEALATHDLSAEEQRKVLQVLLEGHIYHNRIEQAVGVLEQLTHLRRFSE